MTDLQQRPASTFTDDEVEFFRTNGYFVVPGLLDDETRRRMVDCTRRDLAERTAPVEYEAELQYPGAPDSLDAEGGRTVRRLKTAHSRDPVFLEFLQRPSVLNRLRQLLGSPVVMPTAHHNCIMTKQPRFSSDTGWHQDIRYWRFERPDLVTLWLALGAERTENGSLKVIPGSHRQQFDGGRLDEDLFLRTDLEQNQELIRQAVDVSLDPGDALFFHCRTFHAASRNYTDQAKFSAVFTFRDAENRPLPGSRSASMPELTLNGDQSE